MNIDRLREMAEAGLSDKTIARVFDRSIVTVRQTRRAHDIPTYTKCNECDVLFPLERSQNRTVGACPDCLAYLSELYLASPLPARAFARHAKVSAETLRSTALTLFGKTRADLSDEEKSEWLTRLSERKVIEQPERS